MAYLNVLRQIIYSAETPKERDIKCTVPGCSRSWQMRGSKSGFILAAAQRHAYTHWERYHKEQKHPEATWTDSTGFTRSDSSEFCKICKHLSVVSICRDGEK